jgi:proteasome lid subunit RPN8/RPN11
MRYGAIAATDKTPATRYAGLMQVCITAPALAAMIEAARRAHPAEACGLLLGNDGTVTIAQPAANIAAEPLRHFDIDPAALIAAHRAARAGGPAVLGYFHSHPTGPAAPSATDAALAAHDGRIWAIVARDAVTMWRDGPSGFNPLSYDVVAG